MSNLDESPKSIRTALLSTWRNLGRCQYCIRKSFVYAAASWSFAAIAYYVAPFQTHLFPTALAIALTLLWVVHIVAFGLKATTARIRHARATPSVIRRNSLLIFGKFVVAAAASSAMPMVARARNAPCPQCTGAAVECNCHDNCSCGYFCWTCPSGTKMCYNSNGCTGCIDEDQDCIPSPK